MIVKQGSTVININIYIYYISSLIFGAASDGCASCTFQDTIVQAYNAGVHLTPLMCAASVLLPTRQVDQLKT